MTILKTAGIRAGASGAGVAADPLEIKGSVIFDDTQENHFYKAQSSGTREKWTAAFWFRPDGGWDDQDYAIFGAQHNGNNRTMVYLDHYKRLIFYWKTSSAEGWVKLPTSLFRDGTQWYHVVIAFDSAQATDTNRVTFYVNGIKINGNPSYTFATDGSGWPPQNYASQIGYASKILYIGTGDDGTKDLSGYLTDFHMCDNQVYTADDFLMTNPDTGRLIPKITDLNYGNSGFHLKMTDNSSVAKLGWDTSGNGINFDAANMSVHGKYYSAGGDDADFYSGTYTWGKLFDGDENSGAGYVCCGNATARCNFSPKLTGVFSIYGSNGSNSAQSTNKDLVHIKHAGGISTIDLSAVNTSGRTWFEFNSGSSCTDIEYLELEMKSGGQGPYVTAAKLDGAYLKDAEYYESDFCTESPTSHGTGVNGGDVYGQFANWCHDAHLGHTSQQHHYGNTRIRCPNSGSSPVCYGMNYCTMAVNTGKWYCEMIMDANGDAGFGVGDIFVPQSSDVPWPGTGLGGYVYAADTGKKQTNDGAYANYGDSWDDGDVIGMALDLDNGKIWWSKNGTWQASGDPANGTNAAFTDLLTCGSSGWYSILGASGQCGSYALMNLNTGMKPFNYAPPSGFKPWCSEYITKTYKAKPEEWFNTVAYTGTASSKTITTGHKPGLVIITQDESASDNVKPCYDIIRGNNNQIDLWDDVDAKTNANGLTFGSSGVTLGSSNEVNKNSILHNLYSWYVGDTADTPSTAGNITATNQWVHEAAGISISKYTGTGSEDPVGHGLTTKPDMIWVKNFDDNASTYVWHKGMAGTKAIYLDSNAAQVTNANAWGNSPAGTDTKINVGTDLSTNTKAHLMYCFRSVPGFSMINSYYGTDVNPGPFVYCGFKPKMIFIRGFEQTISWVIYSEGNHDDHYTGDWNYPSYFDTQDDYPNVTLGRIKTRANGFLLDGNWEGIDKDGEYKYMFAAFAESPYYDNFGV
tara:strand:- start:852 stop:3767 length:2916 start_codon:yes stop_codon:yes gene_type:complete